MSTATITRTDVVLADMLCENTGSHFLDSGGAYGRMWERNQSAAALMGGKVEWAMARPDAKVDDWGCVYLDLFHHLRHVVEYAPKVDHAWQLWCRIDDTDRWQNDHKFTNSSGTFERFIDALDKKGWGRRDESSGGYTYNHDNLFSQDFMYDFFTLTDDCPFSEGYETPYVAISIHNGCDARGGFTDYRIFEMGHAEWYDVIDGRVGLSYVCDGANDEDPNQLTLDGSLPRACPYTVTGDGYVSCDVRSGDTSWYSTVTGCDDAPEALEDDDHPHSDLHKFRCDCGGVLTLNGVHAEHY